LNNFHLSVFVLN